MINPQYWNEDEFKKSFIKGFKVANNLFSLEDVKLAIKITKEECYDEKENFRLEFTFEQIIQKLLNKWQQ